MKLLSYIKKIEEEYPDKDWNFFKGGIHQQIVFMESQDLTKYFEKFQRITKRLDEIRSESFADTYPEYKELI